VLPADPLLDPQQQRHVVLAVRAPGAEEDEHLDVPFGLPQLRHHLGDGGVRRRLAGVGRIVGGDLATALVAEQPGPGLEAHLVPGGAEDDILAGDLERRLAAERRLAEQLDRDVGRAADPHQVEQLHLARRGAEPDR